MKNLKLSFAVVIAVLAVGFTVATKANSFGVKSITDCFTSLVVTDGSNDATLSDALSKTATEAVYITAGKKYVRSISGTINPNQCVDNAIFCCATIKSTSDAAAPTVLIEGVLGQFELDVVRYKP